MFGLDESSRPNWVKSFCAELMSFAPPLSMTVRKFGGMVTALAAGANAVAAGPTKVATIATTRRAFPAPRRNFDAEDGLDMFENSDLGKVSGHGAPSDDVACAGWLRECVVEIVRSQGHAPFRSLSLEDVVSPRCRARVRLMM